MSKSIAQLRVELETAFFEYRAANNHTPAGDKLAGAAEALLVTLRQRTLARERPFRVTYQHQRGHYAGQIIKESMGTVAEAVNVMDIVVAAGARVEMSVRNTDGSYTALSAGDLAEEGYPQFVGHAQYGDAHYSKVL